MFLMPGLEIVIAAMAAVSNELSYDDKIRRTGGYLQKEVCKIKIKNFGIDPFNRRLLQADCYKMSSIRLWTCWLGVILPRVW